MVLKKMGWFKSVSFLLVFSLACNQTAFGSVQISPAGSPGVKPSTSLSEFATVSDISVSASLGNCRLSDCRPADLSNLLKNSSQKLLIFIEDAHGNISAQKNIANILDWASKEAKVKTPWIALEGTGVGEIDHRVLSAFPHEPTKRITADHFLSTGEIDGAVYYASLFNGRTKLYGVDDDKLAQENRAAYQKYLVSKDGTQKALQNLRTAADFLKNKIYFGDLIRLDNSSLRFERNGNQLLKHLALLEELAKKYKVDLTRFPHISTLIELKTLESKPQASQERVLELSKKLEGIQVFNEIQELNETLWTSLLSYPEAKDARTIDKIVKFYERLFDFSLVPEDYAQYLKNTADYSPDVLQEKIINYNFILRPKTLRPSDTDYTSIKKALPIALNFYELAEKRNAVLTNNLLALAGRNPQKKTFFIAGGFHRSEISKILQQKNIPYAVLSPRITDSQGSDNYWKGMSGEIDTADLALAAFAFGASTVKEVQNLSFSWFRTKAALADLAVSRYLTVKKEEWASLIQSYAKRLDRADARLVTQLQELLVPIGSNAFAASLGGGDLTVSLTENNAVSISASSLGTVICPVNMEVAKTLLDPATDKFQTKSISLKPGLYDYANFRDKVVAALVKTAVASGLHLEQSGETIESVIETQKALLDRMFPTEILKKEFQRSLSLITQTGGLVFEFKDDVDYLFQWDDKAHKITINSAALQSLHNPYAANSFFTFIIYHKFLASNITHGILPNGLTPSHSEAILFYDLMSSLNPKTYQGDTVVKWFQTVRSGTKQSKHDLASSLIELNNSGFAPGAIIGDGRFQIIKFIKAGGMGAVWQAKDLHTDGEAAIKQILPKFLEEEQFRIRFAREIKALQRNKSNPYVAHLIYRKLPSDEVLEKGGTGLLEMDQMFYAMEWVDGQTLDQVIASGSLDNKQKLQIMIKIAEGMKQVQGEPSDTIHRDLKPDNIMIDNSGNIKILDFGLARHITDPDDSMAEKDMTVTAAGTAIGTPHYMSPEQAKGWKDYVNYPTDIASIGAIFYRMMTNHYPYEGTNTNVIMVAVSKGTPRPFTPEDNVPPAMQAIIHKAMAKYWQDLTDEGWEELKNNYGGDPETEKQIMREQGFRYNTMEELLTDLQLYAIGKPLKFARHGKKPSSSLDLQPIRNTGRQQKVTPHRANDRVSPLRQRAEKPASQKSNVGLIAGAVAGGIALLALAIYGLGGKKDIKLDPDKPNGNGPDITKVNPNPIDDATEKARKEAELKKKQEEELRKNFGKEMADIQFKFGALNSVLANTEAAINGMRKELKTAQETSDSVNASSELPVLEAAVAKVKTAGDAVDKNAQTASNLSKDFTDRLTEIKNRVAKLLADPNLSPDQKNDLNNLLQTIGEKLSAADRNNKTIEDLKKQLAASIERVNGNWKAAQDPKTKDLRVAKMEIENIQKLLGEIQKNDAYKKLSDTSKAFPDLLKQIQAKSQEIMTAFKTVSGETTRVAGIASPTEKDTARLTDAKAQLAKLQDELKTFADQIPALQKQFNDNIAALQPSLDQLTKSLDQLTSLKANNDEEIRKTLATAKDSYEEAKALVAEMAKKKADFEKAQAAVVNEAAIADMKIKAESFRLDFNAIESAWKKAQSSKELDNRVTAAQTAYQKAVADAQTDKRLKDPKLTPQQKADFQKEGSAAIAEAKKNWDDTKQKVDDAKREIPKAKDALNAKLTEIFALINGKLSKSNQLTPEDQQKFTNLSTEYSTSLTSLQKSFDIFGLKIDAGINASILLKLDGGSFEDITFLEGYGKEGVSKVVSKPVINVFTEDGKYYYRYNDTGKHNIILTNKSYVHSSSSILEWSLDALFPAPKSKSKIFLGFYDENGKVTYFNMHGETKIIKFVSDFKNKFGGDGYNLGSLASDGGTNIGQIPTVGSWFNIRLIKNSQNEIEFFVDNKRLHSFNLPDGKYKLFFLLDGTTVQNEKVKFSNVLIKGKSLGQRVNILLRDLYKSAQSEFGNGIIILPYDKQLIERIIRPNERLSITNTRLIFITGNNASYDQAKNTFGSPERLKRYGIQIQKINYGVNLTEIKNGQMFILTSDKLNKALSAAAAFFGLEKNKLGRPVIFETHEFASDAKLSSGNLVDVIVVPIETNSDDLIDNLGYRSAHFISAAAISKGDNTNYGFKNVFGKLTLLNELISEFQQNIQSIFSLAHAA